MDVGGGPSPEVTMTEADLSALPAPPEVAMPWWQLVRTMQDFHTARARALGGESVFSLPHHAWQPRRRMLQPLFTKKHVAGFTGHMAAAAHSLAAGWADESLIDIDAESRKLTLRVLGRSMFGLDLDSDAERLAVPARDVLTFITARGLSPIRLPLWIPTPAERRWRRGRTVMWSIRAA